MRYPLIFIFCLIPLISFSQIKGYIVDSNNKGISNANILIKGTKQGCISNKTGYFSLNYNKACVIIISHINYYPKEVNITDINQRLRINIQENTQTLNTVDVNIKAKSDVHKISTSQKDIDKIPALLGENDILKYLASQAGINTRNGLDGGIYIRGGNSCHNEFLIDGHNIYNPNHLSGILSTFDPYAFRTTNTYKSGFPAEYGGKLSSYIDMIPRIGNKNKFEHNLKIGFISSSYKINGPIIKNNTSFVLTIRGSYLQHIAKYYNKTYVDKKDYQSIPRYSFYDISLGTHTKISDKISLSSMTIASKDDLYIKHKDLSKSDFKWSTISSMLKLTYYISDNSILKLQSGYNSYNTEYKIYLSQITRNKTNNQSWINKLKYIFHSGDNLSISTGIQHEFTRYKVNSNIGNSSGELNNIYLRDYNLLGTHIDINYKLNKKTTVESGLRLNKFIGENTSLNYCPRIRVNYKLSEKFDINADFSKTAQYNTLYSAFSINTPSDLWYPLEKNSNPSVCHQYSLNINYNFNDNLSSCFGFFYKEMDNIKEFKDGTSLTNLNLGNSLIEGEGNAKGFESDIKLTSEKINIQCNYTLSESSRRFDDINKGKSYFPAFDIRHNILINANYHITSDIILNSMWTYSSGTYITFPVGIVVCQDFTQTINKIDLAPIYTDRYNFKIPDSHRLDVSLVITKRKDKCTIKYSFGAYNLYNRAIPTFIYFVPEAKDKYLNVLVPKIKSLLPFIPYLSVSFNWK